MIAALLGLVIVLSTASSWWEDQRSRQAYRAWYAEQVRIAEALAVPVEWPPVDLPELGVTAHLRTTCRLSSPTGLGRFHYHLSVSPATAVDERIAALTGRAGKPSTPRPTRRPNQSIAEAYGLGSELAEWEWEQFRRRREELIRESVLRIGLTPEFVIQLNGPGGFKAREEPVQLRGMALEEADGVGVLVANGVSSAACNAEALEFESWSLRSTLR